LDPALAGTIATILIAPPIGAEAKFPINNESFGIVLHRHHLSCSRSLHGNPEWASM